MTWWKHRIVHQNIQYTYFDDLMDDIHKHFVDVDLINKLRDRLDALQQGNGSVQSYISKFKELQVQLGADALTDDQAIHKFKKGLNPQLRVFTNMATASYGPRMHDFDAICKAAVTAEQALTGSMGVKQPHHGFKNNNNNNYNNNNNRGVQKMDLGAFFQQPKQPYQPNRGQNSRGKAPAAYSQKRDITCHYCGKPGHFKKDCYSF